MPLYGTAPRRVAANKWVTAGGRPLTRAGSAYWETHYQAKTTDGMGHVGPFAHRIPLVDVHARAAARGVEDVPGQKPYEKRTPTERMHYKVSVPVPAQHAQGRTVPARRVTVPIGFGGAASMDVARAKAVAAQRAWLKAHPPQPQPPTQAQRHLAQKSFQGLADPGDPDVKAARAAIQAWNAHHSHGLGHVLNAVGDVVGGAISSAIPFDQLKFGAHHQAPGGLRVGVPGIDPGTVQLGGQVAQGLLPGPTGVGHALAIPGNMALNIPKFVGGTLQGLGMGITAASAPGHGAMGAEAQRRTTEAAKTIAAWTVGPHLTSAIAHGDPGELLSSGSLLDAAMLLPGLKPLKGARAAIAGFRGLKPVEEAAAKAALKFIPERVAQMEHWKRIGIPKEQIAQEIKAWDNQAALHPAGPEAFWRDRVGLPSGQSAQEFVAGRPQRVLYQQTRDAERLRAGLRRNGDQDLVGHPPAVEHQALRDAAFHGVDMSVFREHNIEGFLDKIPEYLGRGAPYRHWYENSGKAILRYANGDKELGSRVAQVVAIYSASRKPTENINLATQALRQWQEHGVIRGIATATQDAKANAVMRGEPWVGRKTNRFYANMLKWIDPERYAQEFPGGEVTNDIWMARLFGLKSDAPTPREYDAMTKITQNIAGTHGWSPEEIQAALWVPAKADAGRTITGPGGKKIRTALSDHEAGIDFARALDEESGQAAVEAAPGLRTAPELHARYQGLSREGKQAYFSEKRDAVTQFLRDSGAFGEVSAEGVGIWKNETNPAFTLTFPLGGARAELAGGRKAALSTVSPAGKKFMTAVLSHVSEALHQDAMAWFRPFYRREPISKQNGALLKLTRPLTEQETLRFHQALRERFGGDIPLPPASGNDIFVLNFSGAKNQDFHAGLQQVLEDATRGGEKLTAKRVPFRFDGDYRTRSQYSAAARAGVSPDLGRGRGFAGRPDVREAARRLHDASRGIDERYLGGGAAQDLASGRALYQRDPLSASALPKGATEFLKGGGTRAHFFEGADITTLGHELFHISLHDLKGRHLLTLADEFAGGKPLAEWTDAEHEAAAAAHDHWRATGEITNKKLVGAFNAIKQWTLELLGRAKAQGMVIPQDVEDAFNYMYREPLKGTKPEEQVLSAVRRHGPGAWLTQEAGRSVEMGKRAGQLADVGERAGGGVAGYHAELSVLKGELPREPFDWLTHLSDEQMAHLFAIVEKAPRLQSLDKVSTRAALEDLRAGLVPTPSQRRLIEKAFGKGPVREVTDPLTKHALNIASEILNIPRSFMASLDASGLFRQALVAFAMHPVMTLKEAGPMFKYLLSEGAFTGDMAALKERPRVKLLMDHGLELTEMGGERTKREDYFTSGLAEKLTQWGWMPGVKKLPKGVPGRYGPIRASGRAYTGLLNNLRVALGEHMLNTAERQGIDLSEKELQDISKVANWATGRGHLGEHEQAAQLLNMVFFSPRLMKSRLDMLNPGFYRGLSPIAKKEAKRGAFSLVLGGLGILGTAKMTGVADVEINPASSDFGKLKVGNTRIDIWGGYQQEVRTIAQSIMRQRKSTVTGETRHINPLDPYARYLRAKFAPPIGLGINYWQQKDPTGKPFTWQQSAKDMLIPMVGYDAARAYFDRAAHGDPMAQAILKAAAVYAIGGVGIGTSTYPMKGPVGGGWQPGGGTGGGGGWQPG